MALPPGKRVGGSMDLRLQLRRIFKGDNWVNRMIDLVKVFSTKVCIKNLEIPFIYITSHVMYSSTHLFKETFLDYFLFLGIILKLDNFYFCQFEVVV